MNMTKLSRTARYARSIGYRRNTWGFLRRWRRYERLNGTYTVRTR